LPKLKGAAHYALLSVGAIHLKAVSLLMCCSRDWLTRPDAPTSKIATMPYNEQLAERIRDYLAPLRLPTEEKRMMGGLCFMVRDKMCVGVHEDRLMVRLDPATMPAALARPGCTPMAFTGRPLRSFVFVSPKGWTTTKDFNSWLALALEFNPRAKSSKKSPKKISGLRTAAGAHRKK